MSSHYSNRKIYDNWERLVVAVVKKQQLWEMFHQHSRSPSLLSEASDSSSSFRSSVHQQYLSPSIRSEDSNFTGSYIFLPSTHQRSRSPSIRSEVSHLSSSSSFRSSIHDDVSIDFLSHLCSSWLEEAFPALQPKLSLVSDFNPSFDVDEVFLDISELLGRGTFGDVYTAAMENGVTIVVKRLKCEVTSQVEFKRNMEVVGDLQHENVVPLRAYYSCNDERLLLYDHYSQGSVYSLLHDEKRAHVDWETRLRIAIGAALGISEIHTKDGGKLVHGNIKASNVFINSKMYGCISDVGLANMVSTPFLPTAWCYAPEVKNNTQRISQESDVYSFGILILELLTRKSPINIPGGPKALDLVKLVTSVTGKEWAVKVFDVDLLKNPQVKDDMVKMLQIGIRCVAKFPKGRPSMSAVVKMLEDISPVKATGPLLLGKLTFVGNNNSLFDNEELARATTSLIGKGTFGTSYMDVLENGVTIRVKKLRGVNVSLKEFQTHAAVLGRMRHENVCELRAYCIIENVNLLVYDYISNSSLSVLLHGTGIGADRCKPLNCASRLKIAIGAARGITHIHRQNNGTFVHGNVKATNIFRNKQQFGLISDAGQRILTRPISRTQSHLPPEAINTSRVSQASDVYSFGVVLLELVSGKPSEFTTSDGKLISLVKWIQSFKHEEWTSQVMDIELVNNAEYDLEAMKQLLQTGLNCVASAPEHRPKMIQVVWVLDEISGGMYNLEQPSVESRLEYLLEDLLATVVQ